MVSKEEENEVFQENLKEAIEESKKPEPNGKVQGYVGIVMGLIGIFIPVGIGALFAAIAAVLGIYANKHGQRVLGIICGVLAILGLIFLFFSIKF